MYGRDPAANGGRASTHLLLHSCCAPCSSATLEWLSQYFQITVFYYNPNIAPEGEFQKRLAEQRRLIAHQPAVHPVQLIAGDYEPAAFAAVAKGYETARRGRPLYALLSPTTGKDGGAGQGNGL